MSDEDWAAVGKAIKERMLELALSQTLLARRSGVSRGIVVEIENNRVQRHRQPRTLAALSVALGWHPNHLGAVLRGKPLPKLDDPVDFSADDVPGRLSAIENRLREIQDMTKAIKADVASIAERVQPPK